jgi:putative NIF3 family GTP cyclohydrolase 1 type 2
LDGGPVGGLAGVDALQVEGKPRCASLVSGVTASRALIEAAIAAQADAVLVHHGLFWRGQDGRVTGWMKQRLALLLAHDINLYRLPPAAGCAPRAGQQRAAGAACWAWRPTAASASRTWASSAAARAAAAFADPRAGGACAAGARAAGDLAWRRTARPSSIAWCTGGAQGYFEAAIAAGAQAFLTGEISEPQAHYARECGVAYIACGHHATERYGAPAVAGQVAAQMGLAHEFIDIDNPA